MKYASTSSSEEDPDSAGSVDHSDKHVSLKPRLRLKDAAARLTIEFNRTEDFCITSVDTWWPRMCGLSRWRLLKHSNIIEKTSSHHPAIVIIHQPSMYHHPCIQPSSIPPSIYHLHIYPSPTHPAIFYPSIDHLSSIYPSIYYHPSVIIHHHQSIIIKPSIHPSISNDSFLRSYILFSCYIWHTVLKPTNMMVVIWGFQIVVSKTVLTATLREMCDIPQQHLQCVPAKCSECLTSYFTPINRERIRIRSRSDDFISCFQRLNVTIVRIGSELLSLSL